MSLKNLDNLVKTKQLKKEPPDQTEFDGMLSSGSRRLQDAKFEGLSEDNPFVIVAFRFPSEHSNVSLRFEITKQVTESKVEIVELVILDGDLLTQLVSATYIGDYISMYLAILNGKDPSTVESIDNLKKEMQVRGKTQSNLIEEMEALLG